MANNMNTIEYKFKVTKSVTTLENGRKRNFRFYLGLPFSKRNYKYMQIINFPYEEDEDHEFLVICGRKKDEVFDFGKRIAEYAGGDRAISATSTIIATMFYPSNAGFISITESRSTQLFFDNHFPEELVGEYHDIMHVYTSEKPDDDTIALYLRTNDKVIGVKKTAAYTENADELIAKPSINVFDELAKKDQIISDLKAHIADDDSSIQKQYELIQGYMVTVKDLEEKVKEKEAAIDTLTEEIEDRDRRIKSLTEQIGYLKNDLAARDSEIEELLTDVNNLRDQIGATESKPDETEKTFRGKFIDRIVDEFRRRAEALSDEELLTLMKGTN